MCTAIVDIAEAEGSGRSREGWFSLSHSVVAYDHPQHALLEEGEVLAPHLLALDLRRPAESLLEGQEVLHPERPGLVGVVAVVPLVVAGDDEGRDGKLPQGVGDLLVDRRVGLAVGEIELTVSVPVDVAERDALIQGQDIPRTNHFL